MMDPKLLTPQAGFEDDTLVLCILDESTELEMVFTEHTGRLCLQGNEIFVADYNGSHWNVKDVKLTQIKPLTGKMAVWHLAPESALACMVYETMVQWVEYLPPEGITYDRLLIRPWWAKVAK